MTWATDWTADRSVQRWTQQADQMGEAMQRRGVRVSVVSTTSTQPPMIADELRRQADQFVDIVELQPKISRDPAARAAREAREPRHMPQFLQRGTTPQAAGADEEEFEG